MLKLNNYIYTDEHLNLVKEFLLTQKIDRPDWSDNKKLVFRRRYGKNWELINDKIIYDTISQIYYNNLELSILLVNTGYIQVSSNNLLGPGMYTFVYKFTVIKCFYDSVKNITVLLFINNLNNIFILNKTFSLI